MLVFLNSYNVLKPIPCYIKNTLHRADGAAYKLDLNYQFAISYYGRTESRSSFTLPSVSEIADGTVTEPSKIAA